MTTQDQPPLDPLLERQSHEQEYDDAPLDPMLGGNDAPGPASATREAALVGAGPGSHAGAPGLGGAHAPQEPVIGPAPRGPQGPAEAAYNPMHPDFHDPYYDPDEWDDLHRRMPLVMRVGVIVGVLFLLAAVGYRSARGWVDDRLDPPGPPGRSVEVAVPSGATSDDIARILAQEEVVPSSMVTSYYWRFNDAPAFQAGLYIFRNNMSVKEAQAVLEAGPEPELFNGAKVLIPEGLWLTEVEDRLLDDMPQFDPFELSAALRGGEIRSLYEPADTNDLEGMLFPAVYDVPEEELSDERALIQQMVNQFDIRAGFVGLADAQERVGLTPYEVIIVASLIEEEAKFDEERPKIAQVIYNRLRDGERLEIDATVIRAMGEYPEDGILLESDLTTASPYNTYQIAGLPPTPISSPGQASLAAALSPEAGDWKFYVVIDEDGHHAFANTFEEHQANIRAAEEAGVR